jgi:speckle-type POZ protein
MQSDATISGSGFFEFKIDYSETKNMAVGDLVCSDDISAGGHLWKINCYPRGDKEDEKGEYVSLYLELISDSKGVRTIFHAFCLGREDGASDSNFSLYKRFVKVYSCECPEYPEGPVTWGWRQFVKRSVLESVCVANGRVTFLCNIIVLGADTIPVPPSNIGSDLGCLFDSNVGTDVSFILKGETVQAHRAILAARSPVFRAELFGSMDEATASSITLQDMEPAIFKAMLAYMYTDEMPEDDELGGSPTEMVRHLLAAADRYALDRLKLMCAQKLWGIISVDTFASTLVCAETHSCAELKSKCIDFFAAEKNFKRIVFTADFMWLVQEFPDLAAKLKQRVEI